MTLVCLCGCVCVFPSSLPLHALQVLPLSVAILNNHDNHDLELFKNRGIGDGGWCQWAKRECLLVT